MPDDGHRQDQNREVRDDVGNADADDGVDLPDASSLARPVPEIADGRALENDQRHRCNDQGDDKREHTVNGHPGGEGGKHAAVELQDGDLDGGQA